MYLVKPSRVKDETHRAARCTTHRQGKARQCNVMRCDADTSMEKVKSKGPSRVVEGRAGQSRRDSRGREGKERKGELAVHGLSHCSPDGQEKAPRTP